MSHTLFYVFLTLFFNPLKSHNVSLCLTHFYYYVIEGAPALRAGRPSHSIKGGHPMAGKIYNTARWKRLRAAKLAESPACELCPGWRLRRASHVDHRVAINAGGDPWALSNLQSVCPHCHSAKTARQDGGFGHRRRDDATMGGCDLDGRPLDGGHWWNDSEKIADSREPKTVSPSLSEVSRILK